MRRECLNHLFCWGVRYLDHVVDTYVKYHNTVRPHQGLGNVPIPERDQAPAAAPGNTEPIGKVGCDEWLGGLLKHYYRQAA